MLSNKYKAKREEGFTIIEVLIVLAIAGLIILIVFLAVPALQRNSRNTQRRNDISRVLGLISEHVTNNNGQVPTNIVCTGTVAAGELDLTNVSFSQYECGDFGYTLGGSPTDNISTDTVEIYTGATCSGAAIAGGGSGRAYAATFAVEGSSGPVQQCQQS